MKIRLICALAAAAALFSCSKENIKTTYSTQEGYIESFLNSQLASDSTYYVVSNKGSQRLVVKEGAGDSLAADGTVAFYYAGFVMASSTLSASNLFSTNNKELAGSQGWDLSDTTFFVPDTLSLSGSRLVEGLRNGLLGVKAGEECVILFSGKHGFGDRQLGTIPANSALAYHVLVTYVGGK